MRKKDYVKYLLSKGYQFIDGSRVSLQGKVFQICDGDRMIAGRMQHTYWLISVEK